MKDFLALLLDPALTHVNLFVIVGVAMLLPVIVRHENRSVRVVRVAWVVAFAVLATWIFQQEHHVRVGSFVPTDIQPAAVAFKGSVRYVSKIQAILYESGMWLLLFTGLAFVGIERFILLKRDKA